MSAARAECWTTARIERLLGQGSWFASCSEPLRLAFLEKSRIVTLEDGEPLAWDDGEPFGLGAVLEGKIKAVQFDRNGNEMLMHVAMPGFWFGVASAMGRTRALTSLLSSDATTVFGMNVADALQLRENVSGAQEAMQKLMVDRYQIIFELLQSAQHGTPLQRVALRLLVSASYDRDFEIPKDGLVLAISQSDLASLTGLSRQTVNKTLQVLKDDGIVDLKFNRIQLTDLIGLRDLARL